MMGSYEILCCFIVFLLGLYYYFTANYDFWKKRGVPGPEPILFFGTMKDVLLGKIERGKYYKNIYDAYEDELFVGIFKMRKPILILKNPEIIKDILIKDSAIFSSRGLRQHPKAEPMTQFFFHANGAIAKHIREKVSPMLTPSKLKDMFYIMLQTFERYDNYLGEVLLENNIVNINELCKRLIANMASNTILGINMNTLTKEMNKYTELILTTTDNVDDSYLKLTMRDIFPQFYDLIGYYIFANATLHKYHLSFLEDFMKQRKELGTEKSNIANIIINLKKNPGKLAEITDVTDDFVGVHLFGFLVATIKTSVLTIINILYEVASNQNIQDKLREEIRNTYANRNGELHYEDINAMSYMNAVVKESLRKYPQATVITRMAEENYTIRNSKITIPKNHLVVIPVLAFHHDPKIYPKPEVFDPERFTGGGEAIKFKDPIYFMSFGHGARNCIGERIGLLQVKLALIAILRKYKYEFCEKTINSYESNISAFLLKPDNDIILKITKID